jgi:hypothetical protein
METEKQCELFENAPEKDESRVDLGNGVFLKFCGANKSKVQLYRNYTFLKSFDLSDRVAKRLLVIEAIEHEAIKSRLAKALDISRQTIHNYEETKKHFGLEGLINNYSPSRSKSLRKQRENRSEKRLRGNKARQLEEIRKEQKKEREKIEQQEQLPFGNRTIKPEDQPFNEQHDWKATRYAGGITYLMTLIHDHNWLELIISFFGDHYRLFMVFVLMVANNVRSMEQLKNLRKREGGLILGIGKLPGKTKARIWLYASCKFKVASKLLSSFFLNQVKAGIVSTWLWFIDGHLLPYTGKAHVHQAFNTQRSMMVPGRNNIVACDSDGKIVDFEIQEGKGDIRAFVIGLGEKWKKEIAPGPVMVFDREAYGAEFFFEMNKAEIDFVTWEKNVDSKKLGDLKEDRFNTEFNFNDKTYRVFEDEKVFEHTREDGEKVPFKIRRIYIWNVSSNRRSCALSNTLFEKMDTRQCAIAILHRWGASENTFKHLGEKHPLNYQPGYSFTESSKQEIANPEIKEIKKKATSLKTKLVNLYKKLSKSKEVYNKDGSVRKNSFHRKLLGEIKEKESKIEKLKREASDLPERVDVSFLEDYRCFSRIFGESKYLFDFVTASIWNARKKMAEWLLPLYENKNEYVDLLYAITRCQGWIRSDDKMVLVRLEPLQQPSRLAAQQQFCRKLNNLNVITPGGKRIQVEVGDSPL